MIIARKNIDDKLWNETIDKEANGLPYAYTWYLDAVTDHWYAVVYDNYKTIFPFQIKKKFGLNYSLQPFLTQQLGLFGGNDQLLKKALKEIQQKVWYYHLQLNNFNQANKNVIAIRKNFELPLKTNYFSLRGQYNTNCKRNIKKASKDVEIIIDTKFSNTELLFIKNHSRLDLNKDRENKLKKLLSNAKEEKKLEIIKAYKDNFLLALAILIKTKKRIVYLVSVSSLEGLKNKTMFNIVDRLIQKYADSNLLLDFEGSNIENIARFYQGFGAIQSNYQEIKYNILTKHPLL